jgi:GNAT superfamily N-acetyltransferase
MSDAPATATSVEIRPFRDEDAAGAAGLLRALIPQFVVTTAAVRHWLRNIPERARAAYWVAVREGHIVGWGEAEFRLSSIDPKIGTLWVGVREDARRQGIGRRLYELAERHLVDQGAWKLESWKGADPQGSAFAEHRGFVEARSERLSTLDLRAADTSEFPALEAARATEGYRVVRLRELRHRPRDLHALFDEAQKDVPTDDETRDLDYDEWEQLTWGNPLLDFDLSAVVLHGERPVSFAWLGADREGGRAQHELTGTLRAHRGRGLARLAKLATIRWSTEAGLHTLLTGNDSTNAAMLAVNTRLGYRATIVAAELAKVLQEGRPPLVGAGQSSP